MKLVSDYFGCMVFDDSVMKERLPEEIYEKLQPGVLFDDYTMQQNTLSLIELNKQRQSVEQEIYRQAVQMLPEAPRGSSESEDRQRR